MSDLGDSYGVPTHDRRDILRLFYDNSCTIVLKSVFGVQYRWNWVQRLRYHIDLHDCKVIGLRWLQEADLLYDKEEASADAAWET